MFLRDVAVLELDSHPEHSKGSDPPPSTCPLTHPLHTIYNPLIARPVWDDGIPPTHTIKAAHLI